MKKYTTFMQELFKEMEQLSKEELDNSTDDYEFYYFPEREVKPYGQDKDISTEV